MSNIKTITLIALFIISSSPCFADDYSKGWCDGYKMAIESINKNRDHYRDMMGAPKRSHKENIEWIYSQSWKGPTAPRVIDHPTGIPKYGPDAVDSADLYLIPPNPDSYAAIQLKNGKEITCH